GDITDADRAGAAVGAGHGDEDVTGILVDAVAGRAKGQAAGQVRLDQRHRRRVLEAEERSAGRIAQGQAEYLVGDLEYAIAHDRDRKGRGALARGEGQGARARRVVGARLGRVVAGGIIDRDRAFRAAATGYRNQDAAAVLVDAVDG